MSKKLLIFFLKRNIEILKNILFVEMKIYKINYYLTDMCQGIIACEMIVKLLSNVNGKATV